VLAYASELGISLDRDLTVTGGMPFAGGPLNNYVIQASCRMAELLRGSPGSTGLVTSVSGLLTKQGLGLWSSQPSATPFTSIDVTESVSAANPPVTVLSAYDGIARVAGYTVVYDRGERQRGVAMLDTPTGERVIAWTDNEDLMQRMELEDWVGQDVTCAGDQLVGIA
jgi:acetyl-CoA C-acetyltransferase